MAQRSTHFEIDEGGYFGVVPVSSATGTSRISYSIAGRTAVHGVLPEAQA